MIRQAVGVQFNTWDHVYHFDGQDISLTVGDRVIVRTEIGMEMGAVVNFTEVDEATLDAPLQPIMRRATTEDIHKAQQVEVKKDEVLNVGREITKKSELAMKIVDCAFSFDGGKITFIFTADGRIDFRDLVKELSRIFQKSIRLQQVGIRDEARRLGGFGPCGRELCCKKFLSHLSSVSTDLARAQQVHSRGSDRISGACGRLMCCLAYEVDFYQHAMQNFPPVESKVRTKHGEGKVVSCNVLKKMVNVEVDGSIVEVPVQEVKLL